MNLLELQKYFTPSTVLDIGGHIGEFFNLVKNTFPDAYVFIIEGNKDCEPYLKQLGTKYLIKLLGKENKDVIFYKTKMDPLCTGNSIYKEVTPHFTDNRLIEESVRLHTIDSIFKDETCFDLIKIDTQGSELDILEGGKTIAKKAKGILLEVSLNTYNEGAPLYKDVVKYMEELGFSEKETIGGFTWTTEQQGINLTQKDILFINNNIL